MRASEASIPRPLPALGDENGQSKSQGPKGGEKRFIGPN